MKETTIKAIEKLDVLMIKHIHRLTITRNLLSRQRNYMILAKTPRKPDPGFQFQPSYHTLTRTIFSPNGGNVC